MIGQTVTHYKILSELGRGGMGVVYQAEDLELGRTVAIKFLPLRKDRDREAELRFVNEAKAASALDDPAIGVVHEIGRTEEGRTFIVMGHYPGGSLHEKIEDGSLGPQEALDLATQIAGGIAKAHEKGIVHRDIKPANVLLTADGRAKVIDFGLAKLADQTRLTKTGTTMGTLAYMAPELFRGAGGDERSDVWALGVLLYELVTGQQPFQAETEAALLYSIVQDEPKPVSNLSENLPPGLEAIIARALAKDPGARYQSAAELHADLGAIGEGLAPAQSRLWGVLFRTSGLSRKSTFWRVTALILAGVLLAAAGFLTVRQLQAPGSQRELALAVVDFLDLTTPDDLTVSAGLTGLVHVGLVESCPIRLISPEYLYDLRRRLFGSTRGPIAEDQALSVARRSGASLLLSGQTSILDGNRFITWRLVETENGKSVAAKAIEGDNLAQLADRIISEVLPIIARESGTGTTVAATPVSDLTTSSPQAYQYFVAGILARDGYKAQEAVRNLESAVQIDSTFALALFELSRIYYSGTAAGVQYNLAEQNAAKAWSLRKNLNVRDRLRLEAWREQLDFRVADAIVTYQELLERWPEDREILNNYHRILFYYWYSEQALEVASQGLRLYPDDLNFGLYFQIGLAHQRRLQEALTATHQYLRQHPQEPNSWDELGRRYLSLGLPDSAATAFEQALQIDPDFLSSQTGLADCAYSKGEPDLAIALHEEILQRPDLLPSQIVGIMTDLAFWPGIAFCHAEAGRYERALALFEDAAQLISDPVSEVRLNTGRARMWLLMRRAKDVLQWARSLESFPAGRLAPLVSVQFRARALVMLDSLAAAQQAVNELYATESSWGGVARSEALKVEASIALAQNRPDLALVKLDEATVYGTIYGGFFDLENRETRARAHWLAGHHAEAAHILEGLLEVYGSHALAYYQLGKIYEEMGRTAEARKVYSKFLTAWSTADSNRSELADARQRLVALGGSP